MPKRGDRQPYKVRFLYDNGIGATNAFANLGEAEREARTLFERGADVKVLRVDEDGSRWMLIHYDRESAFPAFTPPLGVFAQEDVNAWIEEQYRKTVGAPVAVTRTGEPKPVKAIGEAAPARPPVRPREDVRLEQPVQVREVRMAENLSGAPLSSAALMAALEILGVGFDGTVHNADPKRGTQFLLSEAQLNKLVELAMHAPEGLR